MSSRNDSIIIPEATAKKIIRDLELGDQYRKLYEVSSIQIDTLSHIVLYQKDLLANREQQIMNYKAVTGAYATIDKNYTNLFTQLNKQNNKTNTILFVTLGVIVSILVIRK